MTKDERIAWLESRVENLEDTNASLTRMLQLSLESKHAQRAKWAAEKREKRQMSDGQIADSPTDIEGDSPTDKRESGSSPEGALGSPPDNPRSVPTVTPSPRETNKARASAREAEAEGFPEWWTTYPANNGSRKDAAVAWRNLTKADQAAALVGAKNYAASERVREGDRRWIKHAEAWLHARLWESWQQPEQPRTTKDNPRHLTEEQLDEMESLFTSRRAS